MRLLSTKMTMNPCYRAMLTTRLFVQRAEDLEWRSLILSLREMGSSVLQKLSRRRQKETTLTSMGSLTLEHVDSRDGYWTAAKFTKQIKNGVNIAEAKYPKEDGYRLFGCLTWVPLIWHLVMHWMPAVWSKSWRCTTTDAWLWVSRRVHLYNKESCSAWKG